MTRVPISRKQVLAYRAAVHGLGGGAADNVLGAGMQDNPPGRTAKLGLVLRGVDLDDRTTALVHSVRAAMHLHRADDVGRYAAAVRPDDGAELSRQSFGPFGEQLAADGVDLGAAVDAVAEALRDVMADGAARTKGELSGAVTPLVDRRVTPWCNGCGVHHVYDALFRYGTLQAGLTIEVESPTSFRFLPPSGTAHRPDRDRSRAEIVRRFLHLAGPVKSAHLASWLGRTPAGAWRWWGLLEDEVTEIAVDRRSGWIRSEDLDELTSAPEPPELRLLGPYDPVTALGDREVLVPDAARRRDVWKAVSNPGVVLVDGDIGGVWRQKTSGNRLTITIRPFDRLGPAHRRAAEADAQTIAGHLGATDVTVRDA
ncbi:MAG: winged helix DNA-binding domain-containing protein [Jiangellaceae bacterium]